MKASEGSEVDEQYQGRINEVSSMVTEWHSKKSLFYTQQSNATSNDVEFPEDKDLHAELMSSPQIPLRANSSLDSQGSLKILLTGKNGSSEYSLQETPTSDSPGREKDNFRQPSAMAFVIYSSSSESPVKRKLNGKNLPHKQPSGEFRFQ